MHKLPDTHFQPVASKTVRLILIGIHGLAILATLANTLPWAIKIILLVLIIGYLVAYLYHCKHSKYRDSIYFSEAEGWSTGFNKNQIQPVKLLGSSLSTRWIIVLHFKMVDTSTRSLLIYRDSLSAKQYHHLRLMLKLYFR